MEQAQSDHDGIYMYNELRQELLKFKEQLAIQKRTHSDGIHRLLGEHIYDGMRLPEAVSPSGIEATRDFELKGDVIVVGYPKAGTTWMQEISFLIHNDVDVDRAKSVNVQDRVPNVELFDFLERAKPVAQPGVFKSHLPERYFDKALKQNSGKFLLIARNPKDTLVSTYHFYQSNVLLGQFEGSWHQFFDLAMNHGLYYNDMFEWYEGWMRHTDKPNVLLVKYESLKKNLPDELKRIASFLDKSLSDEQLQRLSEHLGFDAMKENPRTNYEYLSRVVDGTLKYPFMRKGQIGNWKEYFSDEESQVVDKLYEKHLKASGLSLEFE